MTGQKRDKTVICPATLDGEISSDLAEAYVKTTPPSKLKVLKVITRECDHFVGGTMYKQANHKAFDHCWLCCPLLPSRQDQFLQKSSFGH